MFESDRLERKRVVIVGGGVSGALVAVHLLRQAQLALSVIVVEPRAEVGLGLAYSTSCDDHLLNVPVAGMSALAGEPDHFLTFARRHLEPVEPTDFLSRQFFGTYIRSILAQAVESTGKGSDLVPGNSYTHLQCRVSDLEKWGEGFKVSLVGGEVVFADAVVLALGNLSGLRPGWLDKLPINEKHYIHDPWSSKDWSQLQTAGAEILIVGSGLTAVDKVIELTQGQEHCPARIVSVSRHGLLPGAHLSHPELAVPPSRVAAATALGALHWMRRQARERSDWRLAVDGVRAATQEFWKSLPLKEKRGFLRHLQTYWDVHRHRMAPRIADSIEGLKASGRLKVVAGRLSQMELSGDGRRVEVTISHRGGTRLERLSFDLVINCCGPQSAPRAVDCPFLTRLYERGMVVANDTNSGIKTRDLEVIDSTGQAGTNLYALGPLLKGELLESIAVPEIKVQAQELARAICQSCGRK